MMVAHQDMGHVQDPVDADRIAWGQVVSDNGFSVMAYDVPSSTAWEPGVNAFFVSLRGETSEEITAHWAKLSDGAKSCIRSGLRRGPCFTACCWIASAWCGQSM